ncbi:hypothetical protein [Natrinema salinisoli]|uniref:hypothetical protein n=1 Tax=Natrinema salinisoli TaxID=2878535 RepID=UPI0031BA8B97
MFPERIETERLHLERISHNTVDVFALYEFYSKGNATAEMFSSSLMIVGPPSFFASHSLGVALDLIENSLLKVSSSSSMMIRVGSIEVMSLSGQEAVLASEKMLVELAQLPLF